MTEPAVQIFPGTTTGRGAYTITLPRGTMIAGSNVLSGTITTREEWVAVRYTVCVVDLTRRGWPAGQAEGASLVAVTIWALEVGWGVDEWHFNVGNVHCVPGHDVRCVMMPNGENLVARADLIEGIWEWWNLIGRRYAGALPQFRVGDLLAWNTLRCGGYGGSSVTADEALSIHNRVRRTISADWDQVAGAGADRVRLGWTPGTNLASCRGRERGTDTGSGTGSGGSGSSSSGGGGGGVLLLLLGALLAAAAASKYKKGG